MARAARDADSHFGIVARSRGGAAHAGTVRQYGRFVMDDAVVQQVRAAYARLAGGDLDSFAEVLDPDVHWRGVVSGIVRKRHAY